MTESAGLLDEILARYQALDEDGRRNVAAHARQAAGDRRWLPNPGPQTDAYFSPADVLLFGGQAAGGKSDLLLGLSVQEHRRSLIMRREYVSLAGLTDRMGQILGRAHVRTAPTPRAQTPDGRVVEFGAAQHPGDEEKFQGRGRDFLGLDEAAQFLESQTRFLMGWVRTAIAGQRARVVLATNPPLDARGEWLVPYFGPWLDPAHPKPAKPGELRWFVTAPDGTEVEAESAAPVELDGHVLRPKSRTFVPAALSDNPYLVRTGYRAQLDALPEPLRAAVRDGDFAAARQDDEWQIIPSAWARAAQSRWTPSPPENAPMCAIGVDVARGGKDATALAIRRDGWFAPLIVKPGAETPLGADVAGLVVAHRRDAAVPVIDMGGGYGGAVIEHLQTSNAIPCVGFVPAAASTARTKDGQLKFANLRAEAWWRFREALDPSQPDGSPIALPDDPALLRDLTAPRFKVGPRGVQVEAKDEIKARLGRSPDRGDAVVMAWSEGARWRTHETLWRGDGAASRRPKAVLGREHQKRRR